MAFFINEEKYACSPCIRVLKRGRHISQCTHCRDLRKTNQSHVKCTCAISSAPNPINGCLCEILLTCNCVAQHLQDIPQDSIEPCHSTVQPEITKNSMDSELFKFLADDLDQYLV
ncbi:unnamed protein product [Rhizopus stolonifer]